MNKNRTLFKCILIILLMITLAVFPMHKYKADTRDEAQFDTVITLGIGSNKGSVGYSRGLNGLARGPQDFLILEDSKIAVLDTMNQRIQVFSNGNFDYELDITGANESIWAQAFDYYNGKYYILDLFGDCIAVVDENTEYTYSLSLPENYDAGNFYDITMDSAMMVLHGTDDDRHSPVYFSLPLDNASSPLGFKSADYKMQSHDSVTEITSNTVGQSVVRYKNSTWTLQKDRCDSVSVIGIDSSQRLYVNYYDRVSGTSAMLSERTIRAYDKHGNMTGCARIAFENSEAYPLHNVCVTDDGQVYLMVCLKDRTEIKRITLGKEYNSDMAALEYEARLIDAEDEAEKYAVKDTDDMEDCIQDSLTREEIEESAFAMAQWEWVLAEGNNETTNNMVTVPAHIRKASVGDTIKGVPYCVGQQTTLMQFQMRQPQGYTTGNVNGGGYGRQPGTLGVDCSGFATVVYQLKQYHNTGAFKNFGTEVITSTTESAADKLQPMDFLVRRDVSGMANHMMLFVSYSDGYFRIVDSDTQATYDGVKIRWDRVSVHYDVEENLKYYKGRSPYNASDNTYMPTESPVPTNIVTDEPQVPATTEIPTHSPLSIQGDVNLNGYLDAGDATLILRYIVGLTSLPDEQVELIDMNGNHFADTADATLVLRAVISG